MDSDFVVRSCRRTGVLCALGLAFGGLSLLPTAAQADGLNLSPVGTPTLNQPLTISETGSTSREYAEMEVFYEFNGSSCAGTAGNEMARVNSRSLDWRFPTAGSFSYEGQFVPDEYGSYLLCGFSATSFGSA